MSTASLVEIYKATAAALTANREEWLSFLANLARNYKRSYDNNVLIYAQRRNTTLLATYDEWLENGRQVKKYSKAISVLELSNPKASFKNLFDFMDTVGSAESFNWVLRNVWQLSDEYHPRFIELCNQLYNLDDTSIDACLRGLVRRHLAERLPVYLKGFAVKSQESVLYGMPPEAVTAQLSEIISDSVGYVVFHRCGLSTAMFEQCPSYEQISHVDDLEVFAKMGYSISQTARAALREVNQIIDHIKKERSQAYENRTPDEIQLYAGSGRDAVSRDSGIRDAAGASRPLRKGMAGVHDGDEPGADIRTADDGQAGRNDGGDRQRGGTAPRGRDPIAAGQKPDAADGGHPETGRPHGDADAGGKRDRPGRDSASAEIIPTNSEPPDSAQKPLPGGSSILSEAAVIGRWQERTHDRVLPLPLTGEGAPEEQITALSAWIEQNRNPYLPTYVVMYHATAEKHPILREGLLPSTEKRKRFPVSDSGYVCLATNPRAARGYGELAYPGEAVTVYEILVPLRRLEADAGQLRTRRQAGEKVGRGLAASLVHTNCARVQDAIEPWQIQSFDYEAYLAEITPTEDAAAPTGDAEISPLFDRQIGDAVHIGGKAYELVHFDADTVSLCKWGGTENQDYTAADFAVLWQKNLPDNTSESSKLAPFVVEFFRKRFKGRLGDAAIHRSLLQKFCSPEQTRYAKAVALEDSYRHLNRSFNLSSGRAVEVEPRDFGLLLRSAGWVQVPTWGDLTDHILAEIASGAIPSPEMMQRATQEQSQEDAVAARWRSRTDDRIVPLPTGRGEPENQIAVMSDFLKKNNNPDLPAYTLMYYAAAPNLPVLTEGLQPTPDTYGYVHLAATPDIAKRDGDQANPGGAKIYEVLIPLHKLEADAEQLNALRRAGEKVGRFLDSSLAYGYARVQDGIAAWQIQPFDYQAYHQAEGPSPDAAEAPEAATLPTEQAAALPGTYWMVNDSLYLLSYLDEKKHVLRELSQPSTHLDGSMEELHERIQSGFYAPVPTDAVTLDLLYGRQRGDSVHLGGETYRLMDYTPEVVMVAPQGTTEAITYPILEYTDLWWRDTRNIPVAGSDAILGYRRGDTVTLDGLQYVVSDISPHWIEVTGNMGIPVKLQAEDFTERIRKGSIAAPEAGTNTAHPTAQAVALNRAFFMVNDGLYLLSDLNEKNYIKRNISQPSIAIEGSVEELRDLCSLYIPGPKDAVKVDLVAFIQAAPDDGMANLMKELYTVLVGIPIPPSPGDIMFVKAVNGGLEFAVNVPPPDGDCVTLTWDDLVRSFAQGGKSPSATPPAEAPALEQEEMEDLIDLYLCGRLGDDEPGDVQDYIYSAFENPANSFRDQAVVVSLKYAGVEQDYEINGAHIHISGNSQGIRFSFPTLVIDMDWPHVRDAIKQLILDEQYPGSQPQEDPYNIPGEDPPPPSAPAAADPALELLAMETEYLEQFFSGETAPRGMGMIYRHFTSEPCTADEKAGYLRQYCGDREHTIYGQDHTILCRVKADADGICFLNLDREVLGRVGWERAVAFVDQLIEEKRLLPHIDEYLTADEVIDAVILYQRDEGTRAKTYWSLMNPTLSQKEKIRFVRDSYGTSGVVTTFANGDLNLSHNPREFKIDYRDFRLTVEEKMTWAAVVQRIEAMIARGEYYSPSEDEESSPIPVADSDEGQGMAARATAQGGRPQKQERKKKAQQAEGQLSLFDLLGAPTPDVYEEPEEIPADDEAFALTEGERFFYQGTVYEVIRYMDGGETVEVGDIKQLVTLNGFKITERLRVASLSGVMRVQDSYTDGELSSLIVEAVERETSGDDTGRLKEQIEAAGIVNQVNDEYAKKILDDFQERVGSDGRLNYRFSPEHDLYPGGAKTRFRNNIEAIKLLRELEAQGRLPVAEEQVTLARYAGWGGLANALTPNKAGWEKEYHETLDLLTEDEYKSAVASTTTAYYTDQAIVGQMYRGLLRMGFREGNVMDPGMGVGNFFSALPDEMLHSKLYGVEIDSLSGRIAQKLYPMADVRIQPFEDVELTDSIFDLVVGNVPFNAINISDRRYNKYNFRIHEYFIAKSLDKVRPGGLIAVIASKFLMDKANPSTREYIAQRAELLGAIRLPNTAFKAVAGTEACADILFLRKREREVVPTWAENPWISVEQTADGVPVNSYYVNHPEMLLGRMIFDQSMYANEKTTTCVPNEGDDLMELLAAAVEHLPADCYTEAAPEHWKEGENRVPSIPADPAVKNFSYTIRDDKLYYRENSLMFLQPISGKKAGRIRGLLSIRDALRDLMEFQTDLYNQEKYIPSEYDEQIQMRIAKLNDRYDAFVKEFGYINERGNIIAFSRDADAPLLRSIEDPVKGSDNKETGEWEKTTVFYKPTISIRKIPTVCNSADEALKLSLNMLGRLDLTYMAQVYAHSKDEIIKELGERIYQDPQKYAGNPHLGWEVADAYLSGEVKDKLTEAVLAAEEYPDRFARNVTALRAVQPEPIPAQDISFQISSPWIPVEIYQQFMYETFETSNYRKEGRDAIRIEFSPYTASYHITSKSAERDSVTVTQTYGTDRANAYDIFEDTLNMRTVTVRDPVEYRDDKGEKKTRYVLNKRETILAREKQAKMRAEFERWLFADPARGAQMVKLYNDRFNTIRPRRYNGDDLILPDLSPTIKLREHQREVIAHGIYGDGNLLIGHEVGAGKTFSAVVIAHELKRIGAVSKPLIAVPNHIVGQWASEYLRLYPNANILVATEADFEKSKRRRFVSRVSTGDYDCIIMAHSSFELINLSRERQLEEIEAEIDEITAAIDEQKMRDGKDWSLKQMAAFRKNLQFRYDRLYNDGKKDDTITFEELGCDMLIVDEAHMYKNNFSYTKLRNVGGLSQSRSQRAMDMALKCKYVNQISNGRGVVFLTGTPVSNSMAELYVMQKYLQPQELEKHGIKLFDQWAANFGQITTSLEITPEGRGYQMKTRFVRFNNLPELMAMFTQVADIKTADMLDLPDRPQIQGGGTQIVKVSATEFQKQVMDWLAARAEAIRAGEVNSCDDNFLKLTMEARVAAVDPRILSPDAPDTDETKLVVCARDTAKVYHETAEKRLTQLVFCDTGTPNPDAEFTFYGAFRDVLLQEGVKPEEIAFIHDYNTDAKKKILYDKVKCGDIRILMGSTGKMGTGMNVQDLVIGIQHLDIPWRPSDLTQQDGRGYRQGNKNPEIFIRSYVTEDTFDSYMWQTLENKQRCISQIMTGRSPLRSCEDIDPTTLQYAQFKALGISDPRIKEKMEIDNEVNELQVLKAAWQSQQSTLQYRIANRYPAEIAKLEKTIENLTADLTTYKNNKPAEFSMVVGGEVFDERVRAGERLLVLMKKLGYEIGDSLNVGYYAGFNVSLRRGLSQSISLLLCGQITYEVDIGESALGNITRIENTADRIGWLIRQRQQEREETQKHYADAQKEAGVPFEHEARLAGLLERKAVIDTELEFKDVKDEPDELIDDTVENPDGEGETIKVEAPSKTTEPPFALRGKRGPRRMRRTANDRQAENYDKMRDICDEILVHAAYYMRYEAEGYDNLEIYVMDEDIVSIGHPREVNGKVLYDPEIQFQIVDECRVVPLSFRNDNIGVCRETDTYSQAEKDDLDKFLSEWLDRIAEQPYDLVETRNTVEMVDLDEMMAVVGGHEDTEEASI